jgi:Ni/Co efflux regulator RcnB
MKKVLLSAAALAALLSAPAAMAQDQNNDKPKQEDRANPGNDKQDQGDKPDRGGDRTNGPGGAMQGPGDNNGPDRDRTKDNDKTRNVDVHKNVDVNKNVNVHKTVDKTVVMKARANITAPRRFHITAYVRPPGWYQHRWVYGEMLPRAFFAPEFFIGDFGAYGLIAPWDGYEWVRYGDDALLIDVDTGEVIRVEYGLFY